MDQKDLLEKTKIWAWICSIYGAEPMPDAALAMMMSAFEGFSADELATACSEYMKTGKHAPLPASMIEIMKKRRGQTDSKTADTLIEVRARRFLEDIKSMCRKCVDIVSADWRGVTAFLDVYGSLWRFMTEDLTDNQRRQLERDFVRIYKAERPEISKGYVLRANDRPEGYRTAGHCLIQGDYQAGLKLISEIYSVPVIVDNDPEKLKALEDRRKRQALAYNAPVAESLEERNEAISRVLTELNSMIKGMSI